MNSRPSAVPTANFQPRANSAAMASTTMTTASGGVVNSQSTAL